MFFTDVILIPLDRFLNKARAQEVFLHYKTAFMCIVIMGRDKKRLADDYFVGRSSKIALNAGV